MYLAHGAANSNVYFAPCPQAAALAPAKDQATDMPAEVAVGASAGKTVGLEQAFDIRRLPGANLHQHPPAGIEMDGGTRGNAAIGFEPIGAAVEGQMRIEIAHVG